MRWVRVKNVFSNNAIWIDASRPVTRKKIKAWRVKMQHLTRACGDSLGGCGPQHNPDQYAALLKRVDRVLMSGVDEVKAPGGYQVDLTINVHAGPQWWKTQIFPDREQATKAAKEFRSMFGIDTPVRYTESEPTITFEEWDALGW